MGALFAALLYFLGIFFLGLEIYARTTEGDYVEFGTIDGVLIAIGIIALLIAIAITVSKAKETMWKRKFEESKSTPEFKKKSAELEKLRNDFKNKIVENYQQEIIRISSGHEVFHLSKEEDLVANTSGIYKIFSKDSYKQLYWDKIQWSLDTDARELFKDAIDTKTDLIPLTKKHVAFNQIQCFLKTGDVQYTSKVSGGGGGGYSATGAFIGGLVGGDAGAIIGSRKPVKQVKTTVETHDTRKTQIRYLDDNGMMETFEQDGYDLYDYLVKNIPEKDFLSLQLKQDANTNKSTNEIPSRADRLRELKSLLDDGILTQEEFDTEKKKILNE